ncbi:MAG: PIN domain nuclease [Deferribacteraceae bacterium]|jgi:predicted nucleic acid-binding protein|nr:PIN domain nuclease [Deferribacteraceae bacterium]
MMVLVDTSILIDYFKGKRHEKIDQFDMILSHKIPFGISAYTYQELLQGARNEREFSLLKEYLASQTIYMLPEAVETYEEAAKLYFEARRKGVTPRGTIDLLIAYTCLYYNLPLLHNDRDFDALAKIFPQLKIWMG